MTVDEMRAAIEDAESLGGNTSQEKRRWELSCDRPTTSMAIQEKTAMSLDVYLLTKAVQKRAERIFVRVNGSIHEISRADWEEQNPGVEPCVVSETETDEVYSRNITHNLNRMASAAGIYQDLWRPDEIGVTKARQLIEPLSAGLFRLRQLPDHFRTYNPKNGWGNYEDLVAFVESYLSACETYPDADVYVSR